MQFFYEMIATVCYQRLYLKRGRSGKELNWLWIPHPHIFRIKSHNTYSTTHRLNALNPGTSSRHTLEKKYCVVSQSQTAVSWNWIEEGIRWWVFLSVYCGFKSVFHGALIAWFLFLRYTLLQKISLRPTVGRNIKRFNMFQDLTLHI